MVAGLGNARLMSKPTCKDFFQVHRRAFGGSNPGGNLMNKRAFQIAVLRKAFGDLDGIDPCGPVYVKLCAILDKADIPALREVVAADIPFVSKLARNRLLRAA